MITVYKDMHSAVFCIDKKDKSGYIYYYLNIRKTKATLYMEVITW